MHFIALVHKDTDSVFGVSFPDLPGCFSAADKEQDILPNASEALALFFEDKDADQFTVTSTLEELANKFAAELHGGAFLLPVPYFDMGTLKATEKEFMDDQWGERS